VFEVVVQRLVDSDLELVQCGLEAEFLDLGFRARDGLARLAGRAGHLLALGLESGAAGVQFLECPLDLIPIGQDSYAGRKIQDLAVAV
jgi:hypothetical protein